MIVYRCDRCGCEVVVPPWDGFDIPLPTGWRITYVGEHVDEGTAKHYCSKKCEEKAFPRSGI